MPAPNELPEAVLRAVAWLNNLPPALRSMYRVGGRASYTDEAKEIAAALRAYGEQCRAAGEGREADARRLDWIIGQVGGAEAYFLFGAIPSSPAHARELLDTAMGAGQEGCDG